MKRLLFCVVTCILTGCAPAPVERSANTVKHRFMQPPLRAAQCFAANAEAHSSALVAEVGRPDSRGMINVIVRVKNGVTYATLDLRPANAGSEGTLALMASSPRGTGEIVRSLVEGC